MSVAKPSQTADWAGTAAPGDIVAPSGPKQSLGWVAEIPPHSWFNWWMNLVGQWTDYVNDPAPPTPTYPTLQNGYADQFGVQTLQYWVSNGVVRIAGTANSSGGTATGSLVWSAGALPAALRPVKTVRRSCNIKLHSATDDSGFVDIFADGSLAIYSTTGGSIGRADIQVEFIPGI